MKIKIENAKGTLRYKVAETDSHDYYLVDIQGNFLFVIFPFLLPLFKKRCYQISKEIYEQLRRGEQLQNNVQFRRNSGIIIPTVALTQLVPKNFGVIHNIILSIILLIMVIVIAGYIRFRLGRTPDDIQRILQFKKVTRLRLNYTNLKLPLIYLYQFGSLFILIKIIPLLLKVETNLIFHMATFCVYFIYLFTSLAVYSAGVYTYKISKTLPDY